MVIRRIAKWVGILVVLLLATAIIVALWQDSTPYRPDQVRRLTTLLNEEAAVATPHRSLMTDEQRQQHSELLRTVEAGSELPADRSTAYRELYQAALRNNQSRLGIFDPNLTVETNHRMQEANNVGGKGIPGDHDHHDFSARSNFATLTEALGRIEAADGLFGSLTRVGHANRAYKNLTDIILHLGTAPHTVSVGYRPPAQPPRDQLGTDFEAMLRAYKAAQFAPVNSQIYAAQVHRALDAYDRMVLTVQGRVNAKLSPIERRLAGRWLALHTLSPRPNSDLKVRFPR
jgi:antitoxin (DNA-binding transcriptional repressor) of toxin-antitoxin stability system